MAVVGCLGDGLGAGLVASDLLLSDMFRPTVTPRCGSAAEFSGRPRHWATAGAGRPISCQTRSTAPATVPSANSGGVSDRESRPVLRPRIRWLVMTDPELSELRARAAVGDTDAVDELVERAGERGDFEELRRLAAAGSRDAADELVQLAGERGDLDELRRLAASGSTDAADMLSELGEHYGTVQ